MPELLEIRPATAADAEQIARINHQTWKDTYRGILDDAAIEARSLEDQVKIWQDQLAFESPSETRFVALWDGLLVGYAGAGRNPDTHSPFSAELFGIYVLRDYQKRGIGRALLKPLSAWLLAKGHASMLVWIMRENPYHLFYESLHGKLLEQSRELEYSGKKVTVICYGWPDLKTLL